MRPFAYRRADSAEAAVQAAGAYLAGGTTLLDLMKLDVLRPETVVDLNPLQAALGRIKRTAEGLRLGALVRMSQAAEDETVRRDYPMVAQALELAASPQLRNMASLGGNVLQRTRCPYFRDVSWRACNKREPGSGCAAREGFNRLHAVLGVSESCIAAYPGDFAQALIALDAQVETLGPGGRRSFPFSELHRAPGDRPDQETTLGEGELIAGFVLPAAPWARRSLYVKVRDRESYAFAMASAAVALELDGRIVRQARIALGGLATVPWRARAAEQALVGELLDEASAEAAALAAFAEARPAEHNAFKVPLGERTLVRALLAAGELEVPA